MRHLLLIFTMFFAVCSSGIGSEQTGEAFYEWSDDGMKCTLSVDVEPKINWDGKSSFPIAINEVTDIFDKWADSNLGANEKAFVSNYTLSRTIYEASSNSPKSVWLFRIDYVVFENNKPSSSFNRKIAITLDGKIIEPKCGL